MGEVNFNYLVAYFLGWTHQPLTNEKLECFYTGIPEKPVILAENLRFDTDWNSLMLVIDHINHEVQQGEFCVECQSYFEDRGYHDMMYKANDIVVTSNITGVQHEIKEFINYYNKNKDSWATLKQS